MQRLDPRSCSSGNGWRAVVVRGAFFSSAGAALLTWASADSVRAVAAPGSASFENLLVVVAAALAWLLFGWLLLAGLAVAASVAQQAHRIPASRHHFVRGVNRITPPAGHRVAALILGIALLPPASASASGNRCGDQSGATSIGRSLDRPAPDRIPTSFSPQRPGRLPDRPAEDGVRPGSMRSGPPVGSAQNRPLGGREHLVVRPGDSLWALVARQLGADASARDIAHEWPRWYAANRSTIGADPDLIHPGQLLRAPDNRLPTHSPQEIP